MQQNSRITERNTALIRVLHVIRVMDRAGAETFIMNLYRSIDRTKVQFDFLVNVQREGDYDTEIQSLGGRIFRIPRYNIANAPSYKRACRNFFIDHPEIQIVHGHIGSSAPIYLAEAQRAGKYTIAHSHTNVPCNSFRHILFKLMCRPIRGRADYYMACSLEAGIDRFGNSIVSGPHFAIKNNGINTAAYSRNADSIQLAKHDLGFNNVPVFGHIGRFASEKNHSFLLEVFAAIKATLPEAILVLVGDGPLREKICEKAKSLRIDQSIVFLGVRDDIPYILCALDVFIFPSTHEGLGIAFIEAQASGLECIGSTEIHELAQITDRAKRIPLSEPDRWANECVEAYMRSKTHQDDKHEIVRARGFDCANTAQQMLAFYEKAITDPLQPHQATA